MICSIWRFYFEWNRFVCCVFTVCLSFTATFNFVHNCLLLSVCSSSSTYCYCCCCCCKNLFWSILWLFRALLSIWIYWIHILLSFSQCSYHHSMTVSSIEWMCHSIQNKCNKSVVFWFYIRVDHSFQTHTMLKCFSFWVFTMALISFKCFQRFFTSFSVQHLVFVFCLQNVNFIWSPHSSIWRMLELSIWFEIFGFHQMHRMLVNRCLGFLLLKQTFSFWISVENEFLRFRFTKRRMYRWERESEALQKNSTYIMQCTGLTDFSIRCEHCFQCHRADQTAATTAYTQSGINQTTYTARERECCVWSSERGSNKRQQ